MRILAAAMAAVVAAGGARAAVVDAQPSGFLVAQKVEIAAPAARVWAALGRIGRWWNPKHTWSGDARNLTLALRPDGCFCEILPNGGAAHHMTVIFIAPGKRAILDGTLGPLMYGGVSGHLVWTLTEAGGKTTLTQAYYAGGYFQGGLDKLAPPVDEVLTEQITRLKAYVETGKPA